MTKGDRSIVSDVAGTTRDAIDTAVEHDGTGWSRPSTSTTHTRHEPTALTSFK